MTTGATVWLTGLPSAGKTTIAHALAEPAARARATGSRCSTATRSASSSPRASASAARTGTPTCSASASSPNCSPATACMVLVPVIAPYADSREAVRKRHQASGTAYLEVHVATRRGLLASAT